MLRHSAGAAVPSEFGPQHTASLSGGFRASGGGAG
jgi:hypothetical protein